MPDDAATALRQALEEAARLRRENASLATQARQATTQAYGEAGARLSAQDAAIDGQIAAAEQEHTSNQETWERLQGEGDFKGAAAAMAKMIDASTRMASLRTQKEQLVLQRGQLERNAPQDPAGGNGNQPDPLEGMNDRERDWVSQHPAYLTDPNFRRKAAAAAGYAVNVLNLSRESQEYLDYVNGAVEGNSPPAMSVPSVDPNDPYANNGAPDVTVPRMPQPEVPRPVSVTPDDMPNEMQMVDQMYPQQRAVGNGGAGIRSIAAPPTRTIRELSRQHARGAAIEPTLEELDTARILIPAVLGAEGLAMSDEDKIRTYHAWYNAPSSQRKLRRWYGRAA